MRKSKLTFALLSTAATVGLSGAASAQGTEAFPQINVENGQSYLASDLMGRRVYGVEEEYEANVAVAANSATEWDDIGEIGDFVIGADGSLEAVIVDVGGFLGIGEREVAVAWDAIRPVTEDDDPNEVFLTVPATQEQLEGAPEFTRTTAAGTMDSDGEEVVAAEGATEVEEEATEMAADAETTVAEGEQEIEQAAADTEAAAEAAEEELEEVAADTEQAVDGAAEEVEQAAEATGDAVEAAGEEVAQETAEAVEATGDAVEAAGDEVQEEVAEAEAEVEGQQIEVVETDAEAAPAEGTEMAEGTAMERTVLRTPAVEREGYETVGLDQLTVEDLTGARIYGINDEDIGEVDDLLLSEDGTAIEGAIVGIGGFLGLGEHRIALTMDELQIMRSEGDFRVYVDATKEELEAQPEYEGAS